MQKYLKPIFCFFIGFFILFIAQKALAQDSLGFDYIDNGNLGLTNTQVSDPRELLVNIVRFFLTFIGIIAVVMILYGGYVWMTAQGQAEKVDKAKKILISAIIGLVIIISAYTIVHFIIDTTTTLTSGACDDGEVKSCGCGGTKTCSGGFWGPCVGSDCTIAHNPTAFRVNRTSPRDETPNVIRNVTVKAFLSNSISSNFDQADLNDNFTIEKIADVDPDTGVETPSVVTALVDDISSSSNAKVMNMNSSQDCDNELNTEDCFSAWSRFRVSINDGLQNIETINGQTLECDVNAIDRCHFEFLTNDLVDTSGPRAGIIPTQMCQDDGTLAFDANIVGAWGRDDIGISEIRFYEQKGIFPSQLKHNEVGNQERYQYTEYQYDTFDMDIGDTYTFMIEVDDMASATSSDSFTSIIRAGHCCNGVLDQSSGEEDIDCGGPDCDSCDSKDPMILWLSPDNGAFGNFVTIGGRYFGSGLGQVYFSDGAGVWIQADFPNTVNSACSNNWQNNQIIVVVPDGAQSGPIKVVRSDLKEDTTNNDYGPQINDFEVNSNSYPGLCLVNPQSGNYGDELTYHGTAFSGSGQGIFFGTDISFVESASIFNSDIMASSTAPNLYPRRTTTYVRVDDQNSNYLYFNILRDSSGDPVIDYIDPESGPIGTYMTIFGSGFGNYDNEISKVEFTALSDQTVFWADGFDFPLECQTNWWNRNQIIVKVPLGLTISETYAVTVTNRSDRTSNSHNFLLTAGDPGPGVCLLDPDNGPVNTLVRIIGDNFGVNQETGFVRFFNNQDVNVVSAWDNQKIEVNVPINTETGMLQVSNSIEISNGINFEVGACQADSDCDILAGEECCGSGTFWSGICRPGGTCNTGSLDLTGYGWSFQTGSGNVVVQTCGGYNTNAACISSETCPNSPGTCRTNFDLELDTKCSNIACNNSFSACQGSCAYNQTTNYCEADSAPLTLTCDQVNLSYPEAVCRQVGSQSLWQIDNFSNCPIGTYLDSNGWCTVGIIGNPETCALCDSGFVCNFGTCVIGKEICPSNSACNDGTCVLNHEVCECCCEVGEDARDCCLGLTCSPGGCGDDPVNYGLCSGCRVDLDGDKTNLTQAEQTASDAACNCEGTQGKYCRIDNPTDQSDTGVCVDAAPCDDNVYTPSCEANMDLCGFTEYCDTDCFCKSGKPCDNDNNVLNGCSLSVNCSTNEYCDPSDCFCKEGKICDSDLLTPGCQSDQTMCDSGEICNPANCLCEIDPGLPGDPCFQDINPSLPACNPFACGSGYECLTEDWSNQASACGYCCCDLDQAGTVNDTCLDINENFYCAADQDINSNCHDSDVVTAPNFGICCGCQNDSECSLGISQGCGDDSCCRSRPEIVSVSPSDSSNPFGEVCRNSKIIVEFNEKMDESSFKDNFILFGDFETNNCPEGTSYITKGLLQEKKYGFFKKLSFSSIKFTKKILNSFFPQKEVSAYTAPQTNRNYCAVDGQINSYTESSGKTILEFTPESVLDPARLYYALVKGDADLNSQIGVKSKWGIALNAEAASPSGGSNVFNNVDYQRSYVWSFRTLDDAQDESGICEIAKIKIEPESYLFKTNENDLNEDDVDPNKSSFDSKNDSDKVFVAKALSSDSQVLYPVPGYEWDYTWSINASNIAQFVPVPAFSDNGDKRLIRVQPGVVDGRAIVSAQAISQGFLAPGLSSFSIVGQANIFVFLCDNPWPRIDPVTGLWQPWQDNNLNCTGGPSGCHDTNYELYYCRDIGSEFTYDDLPAIQDESTVNLKESLICSVDNTSCTTVGVNNCGPGNSGNCERRILKESFFFRSDIPDISTIVLNGAVNSIGKTVDLYWDDVANIPPGESLSSYKIYYGVRSKTYTNSIDVSLSQSHSSSNPFSVSDLENDKIYFFAITAIFAGGGESAFSNELELKPEDSSAPNAPQNLSAIPGDSEIELSWEAVQDAESYKIYYGSSQSLVYGNAQDVGNVTELIVSSLTNGQTYYIAIKAIDESGQESSYSNEVVVTPVLND